MHQDDETPILGASELVEDLAVREPDEASRRPRTHNLIDLLALCVKSQGQDGGHGDGENDHGQRHLFQSYIHAGIVALGGKSGVHPWNELMRRVTPMLNATMRNVAPMWHPCLEADLLATGRDS